MSLMKRILSDDENLQKPVYELIKVDHLSNQKLGGICRYITDIFPKKSKQCKLFEGMFKFQSECKWETV